MELLSTTPRGLMACNGLKEEVIENDDLSENESLELEEIEDEKVRAVLRKLHNNVVKIAKQVESTVRIVEQLRLKSSNLVQSSSKDVTPRKESWPPLQTVAQPPSKDSKTVPSSSKIAVTKKGTGSSKKFLSPIKVHESTPMPTRSSSRPVKPNPKYAVSPFDKSNMFSSMLALRSTKKPVPGRQADRTSTMAEKKTSCDESKSIDDVCGSSNVTDVTDNDYTLSEDDGECIGEEVPEKVMLERISAMTSAKPYLCQFIRLISQVPIRLLASDVIKDNSVPVNTGIPRIKLTGAEVHAAFMVDLTNVSSGELVEDGLGSWNSKDGKRSSLRKIFFNSNFEKCDGTDYEYCLLRKRYVHTYCDPPNSVQKNIWLLKGSDQGLLKYGLVSYSIRSDASVAIHDSKPKRFTLPLLNQRADEKSVDDAIGKITSSPVFRKQFIKKMDDLPIELLLQPRIREAPVCPRIPLLDLQKLPPDVPLQMAFLVDIKECGLSRVGNDGLGCWNASGGPRMSVRKTFLKWNKRRCAEGEQDFILYRRIFVHPSCIPEGGVRKFIWLVKVPEGYGRFAVITYDIAANVVLIPIAKKRSKKEQSPSRLMKRQTLETDRAETSAKLRRMIDSEANLADISDESVVYYTHDELAERMTQPSSRCFTEPYHNDEPFNVVFLSDIPEGHSRCAFCGVDFSRYPMPPEDIVLEHAERVWNPRINKYSTTQIQKRYLHARLQCVLSRYEYFTTVDFLAVSQAVRDRLEDVHLQHLLDEFCCTLE